MKFDKSGAWVPRWPVGHLVRTSRFTLRVMDIDRTACTYMVRMLGATLEQKEFYNLTEWAIEEMTHDHLDRLATDHQPPPRLRRSPAVHVRAPRRSALGFDATWRTCLLGAVCAVAGSLAFAWGVTTYRVGPGLLAVLGGFAGLSVGLALATEWGQRKSKSNRHKEGKA